MHYIIEYILDAKQKQSERTIDSNRCHCSATCNYDNNYYGDQTCL